ncbi:MAG TPA: zinc ribbon domain-containing protein [Chthonomonadaceae bacterium]|nr:zinc ribbon domain-containing protein [Chthonomonadaceae bacterium]
MPIFEFHCKSCRTEFKTLRSADRLAEVKCPDCGTDRVARLLSVTARSSSATEEMAPCSMPSGMCCRVDGGPCGSRN